MFEKTLSQVKGSRKSNYTDCPIEEILYPIVIKNVLNLEDMSETEDGFIPKIAVENL